MLKYILKYISCFSSRSSSNNSNNSYSSSNINSSIDTCVIVWKDTEPFIPPISCGQVIKVYDGDTITIAAKLPYDASPLYRFSVRLNGIDSPEIKGHSDEEKEAAKISQQALEKLILHKNVILTNRQTEKYGRILADVYVCDNVSNKNIHLNQWMLDNKYALPYDGGHKNIPASWLIYQSTGSIV